LECELLDRRKFKTQAEARLAVFEFLEGWYNSRRRHSALGYLNPAEFERQAEAPRLRKTPPLPPDPHHPGRREIRTTGEAKSHNSLTVHQTGAGPPIFGGHSRGGP